MTRLCACALGLLVVGSAVAADDLHVLPEKVGETTPQGMVTDYVMKLAIQATERRDAAYEEVNSPDAMVAYQQRMREFFLQQIGGLPERTPLNARTVGSEQRDGYRIEKVIFESQPKHYVTAILYLPEAEPPYPGVLVPCGHSSNGKARDLYQRAPIVIAKSGMAALCYDPIDQGERHQLLDSDGKPIVSSSTMGHNLTGVGAILLGKNTATYRIWDGIRAIDYLAGRPEVDAQQIGCTGISGGGTMTSYLMALDDRIQAAAPGCYLTSFRRLLETIGPQDAEQTIFAQVQYGMDHADYVLMRAPLPTLMMTATEDYFDIDGAWHSFRQAKRWYGRHGFPERVDMVEVAGKHGFPTEMRVGAARWMRRWLLQVDDAVTESEFPVAKDEDLWCTPRGETLLLDGARSVYDLNRDLETELAAERKRLWREAGPTKAMAEVRRISGIRSLDDLPNVSVEKVGSVARKGYRIDKLVLCSEPGIYLPALAFVPEEGHRGRCLYLHADGKETDASAGGAMEKLVMKGHLVLAVDVRGVGETLPGGKHSYGRYLPPDWRDCTIAYLLGKSMLAMRAEDILVCARFLTDYQAEAEEQPVHLVSVGRLGPPSLHAAALEPRLFCKLTLHRSLISWSNVVQTPQSKNQFPNLVHGALRKYDLPDLVTALPAGAVEIIAPLNAAEDPASGG